MTSDSSKGPDLIVNPMRHIEVFNPDTWGDRLIDVIGAGATGSYVGFRLAKLGVMKLRVWDFDTIESHNIGNQGYGINDIGRPKVEVLAERIFRDSGLKIDARNEKFVGQERLGHTVFLLTDSMESRRSIFKKSVRFKTGTKQLIETRMGKQHGNVYSINPSTMFEVKAYEKTLAVDGEPELSACGTPISVGTTAEIIANMAVDQLIHAFAIENGAEDTFDNEIIIGMRPYGIMTRRFTR